MKNINNKGFTLIELIGIVVVLVAIFLVSLPTLSGILKDDESILYEDMVNDLCLAGEAYIYSNVKDFPELSTPNSIIDIPVIVLMKYGSISKNKTHPKTGELIKNHKLKFTVQEDKSLKCEYIDSNIYLNNYILNLFRYSSKKDIFLKNGILYNLSEDSSLMDDRLGATIDPGGNIRYYGPNPNNYIDIGERDSSGDVVLWRIIGVFETKYATESLPCNIDSDGDLHYDNCASEKLVKIIRSDSIGQIVWDNQYKNDWSISSLNTHLNTSSYYPSLPNNVKNKVVSALWNLGGYSATYDEYSNDSYLYERGTDVYDSTPTEWVGKIGLMYPSDYGYATDMSQCDESLYNYGAIKCNENNWLFNNQYQCTITSTSNTSNDVISIEGYGSLNVVGIVSADCDVRPVLYLKSDVCITGEETTRDGINYYIVE